MKLPPSKNKPGQGPVIKVTVNEELVNEVRRVRSTMSRWVKTRETINGED